jgi:hypothetical protein
MTDDLRALAARLIATSPYAMSLDEAQALINARHTRLRAQPARTPEVDLTLPEPLSIVDAPETFGADFVTRKGLKPLGSPPRPKPKPKKAQPGRTPVGVSPEAARRFRIIDGDGDGGGDKAS